MNNRYIQIIATCLIVGTITLALKERQQHPPCCSCTHHANATESSTPAMQSEQPAEKKQIVDSKSILVEPDITKKDLSYKHGFFSYSPTSIEMTICDQEIEVDNDEPILVKMEDNNTVTTCCKYKFIAGYEGVVNSTWEVTGGSTYPAKFSWKTPEKIQLDGAKLIDTKKNSKSGKDHADGHEEKDTSKKETVAQKEDENDDEGTDQASTQPAQKRSTITKSCYTSNPKPISFLK